MSTIKSERWRLRGTDLEIACVLDTPADSDRSPFNAAVYRAWVVGHEALTSAYGESPASAREGAKERATGIPTPPETTDLKRLAELEELDAEADYTIWKLASEIEGVRDVLRPRLDALHELGTAGISLTECVQGLLDEVAALTAKTTELRTLLEMANADIYRREASQTRGTTAFLNMIGHVVLASP